MPLRPRVAWIDGPSVEEILDVTMAACTICDGPARVPEDVFAIIPTPDRSDQVVIVVCDLCTDKVTMEDMATLAAQILVELRRRYDAKGSLE